MSTQVVGFDVAQSRTRELTCFKKLNYLGLTSVSHVLRSPCSLGISCLEVDDITSVPLQNPGHVKDM